MDEERVIAAIDRLEGFVFQLGQIVKLDPSKADLIGAMTPDLDDIVEELREATNDYQ